jgi:hypothetical protein
VWIRFWYGLDSRIYGDRKGTYVLMAFEIHTDRNVTKKEAEMILKYKDLIIEIQRMWNVKAKVIPVITGATGTIPKWNHFKIIQTVPKQHTGQARN